MVSSMAVVDWKGMMSVMSEVVLVVVAQGMPGTDQKKAGSHEN
jgi:hypothetical protein